MRYLLLLLLFFTTCVSAQMIEGIVIDKDTQQPLPGATVYLDGTTIGAMTDENGTFSLSTRSTSKFTLVVTYVGYITFRYEDAFQHQKIKVILEEDANSLDEVKIDKSPFSRKEMLAAFRMQFLGTSKAAKSCKILNEDDLRFYFDVKTNTLSATSISALKIRNAALQYEITFDLSDFASEFTAKSLSFYSLFRSYFSGSTYFKDVSKKGKASKKRRETYYGSAAHLVKSIADQSWDKEGFDFLVDKFPANPYEYFKSVDTLSYKKIILIKDPVKYEKRIIDRSKPITPENWTKEQFPVKTHFNMRYKKANQSSFEFTEKEIIVDKNGLYTPVYGIIFGGFIGTLKAGDMLPSEYNPENAE